MQIRAVIIDATKALVLTVILLLSASNSVAGDTLLLEGHDSSGKEFERLEIGDRIVFFHQRMIEEATVEKDFIVYQFDRNTEELLKKRENWRPDLPAVLPELHISQYEAENMAPGEVEFSNFYYISPESDVFPIYPPPSNPCWVVFSNDESAWEVTIIDAVTGEKVGNGIPPPQEGYSLTGPCYDYPCSGAWISWYRNAAYWFGRMGYPTELGYWPTETEVRARVQDPNVSLFYELAHGGSNYFASGCLGGTSFEYTWSHEIEDWIALYRKMPFTFIGSCGGMCYTGDGTLSYEFRKGSEEDCATVGYCDMAESYCSNCWMVSIDWQNTLFNLMHGENTVKDAFDQAMADYPMCAGSNNCMRFAGDQSFVVETILLAVTTELRDDELVLSWDEWPRADHIYIFRDTAPMFEPDLVGFSNHVAVLPGTGTEYSSSYGIGDQTTNFFYCVMPWDELDGELSRSGIVGEFDYLTDSP